MNQQLTCPHCATVIIAPGDEYIDNDCDACGRDMFAAEDYCDCDYCAPTPAPGDIYETAEGLEVLTPNGSWKLTNNDALALIQGLATMLNARLARPLHAVTTKEGRDAVRAPHERH